MDDWALELDARCGEADVDEDAEDDTVVDPDLVGSPIVGLRRPDDGGLSLLEQALTICRLSALGGLILNGVVKSFLTAAEGFAVSRSRAMSDWFITASRSNKPAS